MKNNKIKFAIAALAVSMIGGVFTGCANKGTDSGADGKEYTITISGSTSVGPLMEKEAAAYMEKNKNVTIEIQQIGSSAGIKNAIDGVSEIGMSSRALKDAEKAAAKNEAICYDGIGVIVHPSNGAADLTIEKVLAIYKGEIKNWKDVGGKDAPIVVVSRESGSGTRAAFEEIVGYKSEELAADAQIQDGNGAVKTFVSTNQNAIGYVSFEVMLKDGNPDPAIKPLTIGGVAATPENVLAQTYKISRPFVVVYRELSDEAKAFIDFIKSEEGQKIAEDSGAIPLK